MSDLSSDYSSNSDDSSESSEEYNDFLDFTADEWALEIGCLTRTVWQQWNAHGCPDPPECEYCYQLLSMEHNAIYQLACKFNSQSNG